MVVSMLANRVLLTRYPHTIILDEHSHNALCTLHTQPSPSFLQFLYRFWASPPTSFPSGSRGQTFLLAFHFPDIALHNTCSPIRRGRKQTIYTRRQVLFYLHLETTRFVKRNKDVESGEEFYPFYTLSLSSIFFLLTLSLVFHSWKPLGPTTWRRYPSFSRSTVFLVYTDARLPRPSHFHGVEWPCRDHFGSHKRRHWVATSRRHGRLNNFDQTTSRKVYCKVW